MTPLHHPWLSWLTLIACVGMGCAQENEASQAIRQQLEADVQARAVQSHCAPTQVFAPGEISLPDRQEFRLALSPDGKTAYYHVATAEPPYETIYETRLVHGHWTPGVPAPFSGAHRDSDPFIAPNGRQLFFSSARPVNGVERSDVDLWVVERERHGWGEPRHLGNVVNSEREELYASVSADGTLYFASGTFTDDGDFNIYQALPSRHGYHKPVPLSFAINSSDYWEFNPWIAPNGKLLFFASANRPDGKGQADIYASVKLFGHWLPAVNLGANVNSENPEFHPTYVAAKERLYFVRLTGETFASDFYGADSLCLLD